MTQDWTLEEALAYYRRQGAPGEQGALVALLREVQVEETYGVRPGGVSASGRFTYRITGCMKNCPNGPSLRWDGALHSRADEALIRALVDEGGGRPSP